MHLSAASETVFVACPLAERVRQDVEHSETKHSRGACGSLQHFEIALLTLAMTQLILHTHLFENIVVRPRQVANITQIKSVTA